VPGGGAAGGGRGGPPPGAAAAAAISVFLVARAGMLASLIDILVYELFRAKIKQIAWAHLEPPFGFHAAKGVRQ
jgi:hypothetical protein